MPVNNSSIKATDLPLWASVTFSMKALILALAFALVGKWKLYQHCRAVRATVILSKLHLLGAFQGYLQLHLLKPFYSFSCKLLDFCAKLSSRRKAKQAAASEQGWHGLGVLGV